MHRTYITPKSDKLALAKKYHGVGYDADEACQIAEGIIRDNWRGPIFEAHVESRYQKARTGLSGFHGPDAYVSLQIVPEGAEPLESLQAHAAKNRGIHLIYLGEGYSEYRGVRSKFGKLIRLAEAIAFLCNRRESRREKRREKAKDLIPTNR
tara:strand:- start:1028 stop:1483 length:456 start_codon:yes stop_codon:yes gene_type:complete